MANPILPLAASPSAPAAGEAPARSGLLAMRVDFAHAVGARLLVYGWVVGLSQTVASALLFAGDSEFDLFVDAVRVPRPDVTQNFRDQGLAGDGHGFLALLEVADLPVSVRTLRLQVVLASGNSADSEWPILRDAAIAGATLRAHEGALRPLIPNLSARQRRVLAGFGATPRLALRVSDLSEPAADGAYALPLHIQLCCVLPGGVLVVGGVLPRPVQEVNTLVLEWDGLRLDLHEGLIRVNELGGQLPAAQGNDLAYLPSGFLFVARLPGGVAPRGQEARIQFACANETGAARPRPRVEAREAQAQFLAYLASVDPNTRMQLFERISALAPAPLAADAGAAAQDGAAAGRAALDDLLKRQWAAAVKDLPGHVDERGPPFSVQLIVDRTVRIADAGIFLTGWFHADATARVEVSCHTEGGQFNVSAHWVRWARPDVDTHLAGLGLAAVEDPGFFCFVPCAPGTRAAYLAVRELPSGPLSAGAAAGRGWRIRVPMPDAAETTAQSIRAVLTAVDPNRRDLRSLMDRHVGPAVSALWAAHRPSRHRAFVEFFGPPCAEPLVSVVVPLYGRHDFVDYQLALFADDPDFQRLDLVYVVDDPGIVQAFRATCQDLYGMYRVPFTLAYPGDNLGFAGATNYGAAIARAPHLLLLNSDVMPQSPGWLGRLLAIYRSHPDTGLLGAKLLYEDGSVQHAGMASRRNPQWQDMWINHHPHKGMNPALLAGTRDVEAVTAACALVETALYRTLGGLSEDYVIGDFEDSDLCHRVRAQGRVNRVALDVALYHLERQSQARAGDAQWRMALTLYNCWLHDRRWSAAMGAAA